MTWTRRQFALSIALAGLAGCARLKQSNLTRFAPNRGRKKDRFLRVAFINEPHLVNAQSAGMVGRAVNAINNDADIDFVVVSGNLTASGSLAEMALVYRTLERLRVPYFCLPGDQDQQGPALEPDDHYQRYFERPRWKENWGAWTFIGLDFPAHSDAATQSNESLVWLEAQLARIDSSRPLVLFSPQPINPDGPGSPLENGIDVLARFQYHNLQLVVNGGYRGNADSVVDKVRFVSTAGCSSVVDNEDGTEAKGFRVFTLDGGTVTHEFVPVPL